MDAHQFDSFTRAIASNSTRRSLLRGLVGGAAALVGLRAGVTNAAPKGKVGICHYDAKTGAYSPIIIPANALDAHVGHGDLVACEGNRKLDLSSCSCDCNLTCEPSFVLDAEACSCVCNRSCDPGYELDEEACACACNRTCDPGHDLNPETCSCTARPLSTCAAGSQLGSPCGVGGVCMLNPTQGPNIYCLAPEHRCDLQCSFSTPCVAGSTCVDDGTCPTAHCHYNG